MKRTNGMRCEECDALAHVIDSRGLTSGGVRRRRECRRCGARFTTIEVKMDDYRPLRDAAEAMILVGDRIKRYGL